MLRNRTMTKIKWTNEKKIKTKLNLSVIFLDMEVTCLTTIREKIRYKTERLTKNILVRTKK